VVFDSEVLEEDTIQMQLVKIKPKLNGRSRCGENGKIIGCSYCGEMATVYHLSWHSLWCNTCDIGVLKQDFHDLGNK